MTLSFRSFIKHGTSILYLRRLKRLSSSGFRNVLSKSFRNQERMQLLSPLMAEGLGPARAREIKARICEQTGLSERTLRRYLAKYRQDGFSGVKPKGKGRQPSDQTIPPDVLEQAILLRREVPGRSVAQLHSNSGCEGRIQPGQIKRSTLQEELAQRGYSTRHKRMYAGSSSATVPVVATVRPSSAVRRSEPKTAF